MTTVGSLCSGYLGLDLALELIVPDAELCWTAENDPLAAQIIAVRAPDVPNYGDITRIDWTRVDPVVWMTMGFPCTDLSHAGRRAGLRPDTRSGVWFHCAYAIGQVRPKFVLIENVRGLPSASAERGVVDEEAAGDLGSGVDDVEVDGPRALGVVLGDLADLGYDARWIGVRASDAGACHGRMRIFIFAWRRDVDPATAADAGGEALGLWSGLRAGGSGEVGRGRSDDDGPSGSAPDPQPVPLDELRDPFRLARAAGGGRGADGDEARSGARSGGAVDRPRDAADPGRDRAEARRSLWRAVDDELGLFAAVHDDASTGTAWGPYEAAIRQWERVVDRVAPRPTARGRRGERLNARFVEWMMGLPEGWVTDVDIPRPAMLKALGNGVVPQQAALALRVLLAADWPVAA